MDKLLHFFNDPLNLHPLTVIDPHSPGSKNSQHGIYRRYFAAVEEDDDQLTTQSAD